MSARAASGGSQTLERGLRLLRVLGEHPAGLSVSELASAHGHASRGIYRLLGPLIDQRLVVRSQDGRHTLGTGLIELASRVRPRLQEVAVAELRRLADELGRPPPLTVRDDEEAVVAAVVEPRNTDMHIAYRSGLRHRLDQAASGIAILAALPPRDGEREAIRVARERGWSQSTSELLPGSTGIGAAIRPPGGVVEASISAVWTDARDPAVAAAPLMRSATAIGAALG
ncbi:MAG: helix-turn-helix domain-containing protein [Solirubrobacterales bacterium]